MSNDISIDDMNKYKSNEQPPMGVPGGITFESGDNGGGNTGDGGGNTGDGGGEIIEAAQASTGNYKSASSVLPTYTMPTVNSQSWTNTGKGLVVDDVDYSWNSDAVRTSQLKYAQDVLEGKADALENRKAIEANIAQYQLEADMKQYSEAQNAEKVGWTGGYVLDQQRQMEYLKMTLQANLYGSMELQKYGYDTMLNTARIAYELNQEELARQYYNEAVSLALNEAEITGYYFSPELTEIMNQISISQQNGDYDTANRLTNILKANKISTEGIKTLSRIQLEYQAVQDAVNQAWTQYYAAIESAENKEEDGLVIVSRDANGNPIYNADTGLVETLNFSSASADKILEFASISESNKNSVLNTMKGMVQALNNVYETQEEYDAALASLKNQIGSIAANAIFNFDIDEYAKGYCTLKQSSGGGGGGGKTDTPTVDDTTGEGGSQVDADGTKTTTDGGLIMPSADADDATVDEVTIPIVNENGEITETSIDIQKATKEQIHSALKAGAITEVTIMTYYKQRLTSLDYQFTTQKALDDAVEIIVKDFESRIGELDTSELFKEKVPNGLLPSGAFTWSADDIRSYAKQHLHVQPIAVDPTTLVDGKGNTVIVSQTDINTNGATYKDVTLSKIQVATLYNDVQNYVGGVTFDESTGMYTYKYTKTNMFNGEKDKSISSTKAFAIYTEDQLKDLLNTDDLKKAKKGQKIIITNNGSSMVYKIFIDPIVVEGALFSGNKERVYKIYYEPKDK